MTTTPIHPTLGDNNTRISHAYIAPPDIAEKLAMSVVCSGTGARPCMACAHCSKASRGIHPDIITISKLPDKKDIVIEQIRSLKHDVIVVPNEAARKAYLVNEAELMNTNAQNAFLQILEEPPGHAVFILKTENPGELLTTIRSRCVELKTTDNPEALEDPAGAAAAEMAGSFFSAISKGKAQLVEFMFALEKADRYTFIAFIRAARERAASELRKEALAIHNNPTASMTPAPMISATQAAPAAPATQASKTQSTPAATANALTYSRAEQILSKAMEYLDMNVNIGHISGMICATMLETMQGA
ncbi:MAG: DNA polymerase III subunit [Oscillospiraceae bacterium]|nr:DNA polymerase III subunit [Oscillospiraceae bacterium]